MVQVQKASAVGELYTIDAASKIKGVSYPTMYRWIRRNNVQRLQIGNTFLVRLADLAAYQPRY